MASSAMMRTLLLAACLPSTRAEPSPTSSAGDETCPAGSPTCGDADDDAAALLNVKLTEVKRHDSASMTPMWVPSNAELSVSGFNNQGHNIAGPFILNSYQECQQKCDSTHGCKYWTRVTGNSQCWLKSSALEPTNWHGDDVVSGYGKQLTSSEPCAKAENKNAYGKNIGKAQGYYSDELKCCFACHAQTDCRMWTWVKGNGECWLKAAVTNPDHWTYDTAVISGYTYR